MSRLSFEKVLTENPFVDELVYYTKILGYGTVLKDEQQALAAETKDSLSAGELYVACCEGKVTYELVPITKEALVGTTLDPSMYDFYLENPDRIPENFKDIVHKNAVQVYINNYEEQNSYYRMLSGKPPVDDYGLFVTDDYMYLLPEELVLDLSKPVHNMSEYEINTLESYGVLDAMRRDNPDLKYLDYLGEYSIPVYTSRSAEKFHPLYIPHVESIEVYEKYADALIKNRHFILATMYSEAYKYGSDHYDGYIASVIILQTMTDIIAEVQEFIARKEIFDSRSIKYLLASNNIPYYSEIPIKYQKALIKNLHTLLKYKSTDRNIIDICSLFGFDDIEIFKYYLLKQRQTDDKGNFVFGFKEEIDDEGMSHYVPDDSVAYDLKFVRVPFEDDADDYIKSEANYVDYDEVTDSDFFWANEVDKNELRKELLRQEFTYIRSKYYSIENVYEASRLSFDIPYFYNILFDNSELEELLTITVFNISDSVSQFKLTDLFCFLFALTYAYHNIEDDIIAIDQTKSLAVLGFNFKADLEALNSYIIDQGFTLKELGADSFTIPESSILTMNQLLSIYTNNTKCYNNIIYGLKHAENKRIYDVYKKLYDTLLLTEHTNEFFRLPNGEMPITMSQYLANRDPALYKTLTTVKAMTDDDAKRQLITGYVTTIVYALEEFLDSDEFRYIYNGMPGVSSEFIKQYIIKLINFFKSYKIDIISFNTIYKFDDKFMNWIKIIDGMEFTVKTNPHEYAMIRELVSETAKFDYKESIKPKDKLYLDISTWVYLVLGNSKDRYEITETIYNLLVSTLMTDEYDIEDGIEFYSVTTYDEHLLIEPNMKQLIVSILKKEYIKPSEAIDTLMYTYDKFDYVNIEDHHHFTLTHLLASVMEYVELRKVKVELEKKDSFPYKDRLYIAEISE